MLPSNMGKFCPSAPNSFNGFKIILLATFFTSFISHRKTAKHDERPKAGELLDPRELEVVQVDQPKSRPEESLAGFPEADNFKRVSAMVRKW